ncbi:Two-component response regulator [Thalictrum thalictroides]|uniref:Two-component response regulator n=1 Tax=Thalictrum thalictroides TaxID=46969 RepID=A0A7J6VF86_THATH|nr:Two-component response regulator [Thalictrum thalictroides]
MTSIINHIQLSVTIASGGGEALNLLKDAKRKFDLVLCDLYMPGIDGFCLLEIARAIYNIPFVFMSSDNKLDVMERGLEAGALFFFPKPLTMMNFENMWQFVYIENVGHFQEINIKDQVRPPHPPPHDGSSSLFINDGIRRQGRNSSSTFNNSNGKKRRQDDDHDNKKKKRPYKKREKEDHDFGKKIAVVPLKKRRVNWNSQLHEKFLHALSILCLARAVPKKILALMKVKDVSRANIASHLQKYRLYQNKYKGTLGSDCPRRRIRMRLPVESEYHDYSPSHDHSIRSDYSPSRPHSPLLENQPGLQDNFSPNNLNQVPSNHRQYHFKEGSNVNFIAQENYGNQAAVTNEGYLESPWMSDTTPVMAEHQINQGMQGFLPNAPLDPKFDKLSFESLPNNSLPSTDIENIGALSAWNGILTGTIDGDIPNTNNSADHINTVDEICKGKKPVEEVEDEFSLLYNLLDFNGVNSNLTSLGEHFVNPNYVALGESSTSVLVNPNNLKQRNEVNDSGWFNSVDDIANFLPNQESENANKACVFLKPQFKFYD